MKLNNNQQAFFALVKAGLWEEAARISRFERVDYSEVLRIAEEQAVVGLVTAGLEHVIDLNVPKENLLQFIGQSLQLEQSNLSTNEYLAWLIERLREEDVYAILVKGQGVAQCYEKPLWRASGDIDLLLSESNYEKAKKVLVPQAVDVESEYKTFKHLGMTMKGGYVVELHGTLHCRLSKRVDRVIDEAQKDVFFGDNVRSWQNGSTTVFLPAPENDVIFVFSHILHHYYIEGIGLRQICDWCRLMWSYRETMNKELLESRIREAGLMSEWKAFATLAVDWLGMPEEAMPLYSSEKKWIKKANRIISFILETGNFGHNREYYLSNNKIIEKIQLGWHKMRDFIRHGNVFPIDSVKFFFHFVKDGVVLAVTHER